MLLKRDTRLTQPRLRRPGEHLWRVCRYATSRPGNVVRLQEELDKLWNATATGAQLRFPIQDAYLPEMAFSDFDSDLMLTDEAIESLQALWFDTSAKMGWRCFLERRP